MELSARIALVTGASRGIGRAIALALAEAGASVAVNYRARASEAMVVAEAIRSKGKRAVTAAADVSLRQPVMEMIARVERELGPVDILINNAGIAITRGVDDLSEEDFDRTIAVNLKSAFLCTQAVLPGMRARRWGRIVNISSGRHEVRAGSACIIMLPRRVSKDSLAVMRGGLLMRALPSMR